MKKKTFLIVLVVAICLLAIFSGIGKKGDSFSLFGGYTYENAGRYNAGAASIDEDVTKVDISWIEGRVEVEYHDGDEIVLQEKASGKLTRKAELRWLVDDDTLYVKYASSGFRGSSNLNKQLTVLLPNRIDLDKVTVNAVSAGISVEALDAETVLFDTVSGSVTAGKINADDVKINTVSGSVKMDEARVDAVEVNTTSGSVVLAFENTPDSIKTGTVSGKVTLRLPEDAGFTAKLDSVSGSVKCSFPAEQDGKKYVCGNGECEINADSVSGSLVLEENK